MRIPILCFFSLILGSSVIHAQTSAVTDSTELYLEEIDRLLLESAAAVNCVSLDSCFLNVYEYDWDEVPTVDSLTLVHRLNALDMETPIDMAYRPELESYIQFYTGKRRKQMSRMLDVSQFYFPMFEEHLAKHNIPLELKYLAVVESALNPHARSRVGATGLWQFMYATGKAYGLEVNSYYDERTDPLLSTEAACRYLKKLHSLYDDWLLALAAYNAGPGNVNKAIRRSGGKTTYWGIRPFLPKETRGYVPAFIAVNYAMTFATEHNIYPDGMSIGLFESDTIMVREKLRFDQIAAYTNMSEEELVWLNPLYTKKVIPGNQGPMVLRLYRDECKNFISYKDSMLNYKPELIEEYIEERVAAKGSQSYYTVRSGDVLGVIAQRNGVSVSDLRAWNNLRGNMIRPGQKLVLYGAKNSTKEAPKINSKTSDNGTGDYIYHTVRRGDTLWDIAKLYPGVSSSDIERLNPGVNSKNLKLGQKLKIQKRSS